jgi:hypothetical protein
MHALLRWLGVLFMVAGIGIDVFGLAGQSKRRDAQAASHSAPSPSLVVGPYAPALTVGLYAQNRAYSAWAALGQQNTIDIYMLSKFTERVTIGFDRPVKACAGSQSHRSRFLRVFPIAGVPGYSAVTFFSTAKRLAPEGAGVVCRLAQPVSSARTDGDALAPIDPIVRRHRLEYAAHAALINAPGALYPDHDPPLKHVALGLHTDP